MRKVKLALLVCLSSIFLFGCTTSKKSAESEQANTQVNAPTDIYSVELRQNDYRGSVTRTLLFRENIIKLVTDMKQNNVTIREGKPNSYWTEEGFQDFVSTFLTIPIINDTQWFNEEETDFQTVINQMISVDNSFTVPNGEGGYSSQYSGMVINRNEKDDYSIIGIQGSFFNVDVSYNGNISYRILYDCDKDWCKAISTMDIKADNIPPITKEMFEYARIDNDTFIIQTSTERLYIKLSKVENDTDLRNREIEEFYYSRLTAGKRTTFKEYEPLEEIDIKTGTAINDNIRVNSLMASYPQLNENGEIANLYGKLDTFFAFGENLKKLNHNWVYQDNALQQAILYKNGNLVVTTFNKLTESYEQFIYHKEDKPDKTLLTFIDVNKLVGVQTIPKAEERETESDSDYDEE